MLLLIFLLVVLTDVFVAVLVDIGVPLLEERKEVVVWKGRLPRAHAEDDDKPRQARPRQRRWGHGGGVVYVSKRSARKYWR